jgi:hypothetical protein
MPSHQNQQGGQTKTFLKPVGNPAPCVLNFYLFNFFYCCKQFNNSFYLEIVQNHDNSMDLLDKAVGTITSMLVLWFIITPSTLQVTSPDWFTWQMNFRLDMATHFIQQAQHHRHAVDCLPLDQLQSFYSKLQLQAKEKGCFLLTFQPSDFFKLNYPTSMMVLMIISYSTFLWCQRTVSSDSFVYIHFPYPSLTCSH